VTGSRAESLQRRSRISMASRMRSAVCATPSFSLMAVHALDTVLYVMPHAVAIAVNVLPSPSNLRMSTSRSSIAAVDLPQDRA
jgi:hypothetical protein